jgi:hypothetical protein
MWAVRACSGTNRVQLSVSFGRAAASNPVEMHENALAGEFAENLTIHLLTSQETAGTLRPIHVLHSRGKHFDAHLLDSPAKNCDRGKGRRSLFSTIRISQRGQTQTIDD